MAYMRRIVDTGRIVESKKMMTSRVHSQNATRAKNRTKTSKAQDKVNERKAEEKLRWSLNGNFGRGDLHTVFHYFDKGRTLDEALADIKAVLRELRKMCKKLRIPWKYIACTETKRMTNIHHHVILPKMDPGIIAAAWEKVTGDSGGGISFRPLDRRGNHAKLARYLIKEVRSTQTRMKELGRRMKRYSTSRGLKKPKIRYQVIPARSWQDEPKQRKGFLLLKFEDGEVTRQGWHEVNGWPWQEYFEIKTGGRKDE